MFHWLGPEPVSNGMTYDREQMPALAAAEHAAEAGLDSSLYFANI